jgi:UDP-GlcNAc:undecaprenyl-phosphate/decaprenyl-phosphate GlcNAc-1-phosphate transferase
MGHSHMRAVLLMYLWAGIVAFAAVSLSVFDSPVIVLTVTALVATCAVGLIALPRLRRRGLLPWDRKDRVKTGAGHDSPSDA